MSLARAVTRRIKRSDSTKESTSLPKRSQTVRSPSKNTTMHIDRAKISLPVALVSTTNMLSYNAPDITPMKHIPSTTESTPFSADDSDHSVSTRSRASSQGSRDTTLTDASSVDCHSDSPASNHLSGYFPVAGKQVRKSVSTASLQQVKEEIAEPVPALPQRALSHSKRAHERLAHKRSLQNVNLRSSTDSHRQSREQRSSLDMFNPTIHEEAHPFGRELEQLNEVVEEFSGVARNAETEADLTIMRSKNLAALCVADYLAEIRPLFGIRFGIPQAAPMAWI